jgi:hypothetical protein
LQREHSNTSFTAEGEEMTDTPEDGLLRSMAAAGESAHAIAKPLKGTAGSVRGRARVLKIMLASDRKRFPMRILTLPMIIATVLTATPTLAQTYDPRYPVCLQVYQGFTDYYFECAYTSLAQCNMSAYGRSAQCIINPYYAKAPPRRRDQRKRVY